MNRKTLAKRVESEYGRNADEIDEALELLLTEIGTALASGERVSLGDYGIFIPRNRPSRSDDRIRVWTSEPQNTSRKTVLFKPGKSFLTLVNETHEE